MAKNNPELHSDSEHLKLGKVDMLRLGKIPKALSAIVMGVLLAFSADAETAQAQDAATYRNGKCELVTYISGIYVTKAVAANVEQKDCSLDSPFVAVPVSGDSQSQPIQQPAVVATEAVVVTSNQEGSAPSGAQQPENQGQYVQGEVAPQPEKALSAYFKEGRCHLGYYDPDKADYVSKLSIESTQQGCSLSLFDGAELNLQQASTPSEAIQPQAPQVENQQPSKAYVETAQKLGRVEVVEGQGLVKLFIALSTCLSGLFYPAAAGLIFVVAYKLAGQMWRNSKG